MLPWSWCHCSIELLGHTTTRRQKIWDPAPPTRVVHWLHAHGRNRPACQWTPPQRSIHSVIVPIVNRCGKLALIIMQSCNFILESAFLFKLASAPFPPPCHKYKQKSENSRGEDAPSQITVININFNPNLSSFLQFLHNQAVTRKKYRGWADERNWEINIVETSGGNVFLFNLLFTVIEWDTACSLSGVWKVRNGGKSLRPADNKFKRCVGNDRRRGVG